MPNRKRPLEIMSSVAISLAVMMGSRSTIRQMPVPIFRLVVTAAAAPRATKGSMECQYSRGQVGAAGPGTAAAGRYVGVLRHPQGLKTPFFQGYGQFRRAHRVVGYKVQDTDIHWLPPLFVIHESAAADEFSPMMSIAK